MDTHQTCEQVIHFMHFFQSIFFFFSVLSTFLSCASYILGLFSSVIGDIWGSLTLTYVTEGWLKQLLKSFTKIYCLEEELLYFNFPMRMYVWN